MVQFIDIISLEKTYVPQRTLYTFKFNLLSGEACSTLGFFYLNFFFTKIRCTN